MGIFSNIFWKSYYLVTNPNNLYKKGWQDAINNLPRHQYRLANIFKQYRKTQDVYDKGYNDGLKEKMIRKF
jgi:hypothetical protein